MKSTFTVLLFLFSSMIISCAQPNDFKYKGTLPDGSYMILEDASNTIEEIDGNTIALRNRVYIMIDSLENLYLNGHLVEIEDFSKHYRYIFTNPDQHDHLPEKEEAAVLFSNLINWQTTTFQDTVQVFKIQYLLIKITNTTYDLMQQYLVETLGKDWSSISAAEVAAVQKKFTPSIAIPSYEDNMGIDELLPPWAEEEPDLNNIKERNVFKVLVNKENEVFVRGASTAISQLRELAKDFIKNPKQKVALSESPQKAIISLTNDRGTSYEIYLEVYNELKGAYDDLREEEAQARFGKSYSEVNKDEKKIIRMAIPFILSESEPSNFDEK